MEKEELKQLVHEIYVQNRYLFQKYKHEVSHFSRNGNGKTDTLTVSGRRSLLRLVIYHRLT